MISGLIRPETVFTAVMVGSILVLIVGASRVVLEEPLVQLGWQDWQYVAGAWLVSAFVNTVAIRFYSEEVYTHIIQGVEGNTVEMFQAVTYTPVTWSLAFVYLAGFPFIVIFTYFAVRDQDYAAAYRYATAYALAPVLSLPFFLLFPVEVTAHAIPRVEPLLYTLHPAVTAWIGSVDSLVKAFPSLHVALSFIAVLYARHASRAYYLFVWAAAIVVTVSTFYLGIHWIFDAIAGVGITVIAYVLTDHILPAKKMQAALVHRRRTYAKEV